jgi:hypothetical protein
VHRLVVATLVTIAYMALMALLQPYKRKGLNVLSTLAVQFILSVVFFFGLLMRVYSNITISYGPQRARELVDLGSRDEMVYWVAAFIGSSTISFVALIILQAFSKVQAPRTFYLVGSHELLEMDLAPRKRYHLFLSHIWSSRQGLSPPARPRRYAEPHGRLAAHSSLSSHLPRVADQVATIKRQLQLLLPGVQTFLEQKRPSI